MLNKQESKPDVAVNVDLPAPKVGILDWLCTIPFLMFFWAELILCDVVQRAGLIFGKKFHDRACTLLNKSIKATFRLTGTKFTVVQYGEIPKDAALVITSNHQSMFDIPILHSIFSEHNPKYISKVELAKGIPGISFNLRHGRHALINRKNARQALVEVQRLGALVEQGECAAVIFPEGTRARRGALKRFRHAGMAMMLQTVPFATVVPVTLDGSWKLTAYNTLPVPFGVHVKVTIGAPINAPDHDSLKLFMDELYSVTEHTLRGMREEDSADQDKH